MTDTRTNRRNFLKTAAVTAGAAGAVTVPLAAPASDLTHFVEGGRLPTREFGNTGVQVPIMHLGTSQRLDQDYDKVLHRSFANGVTWFDTALSYGRGASHNAIANFIDQMGDRKKLWLTSKSGSYRVSGLRRGADEALEELRTDYLDIFLMHGIDDTDMLEPEYLKLGEELKRAGKTRFFGFSCHDGNVVELLNKAAKVGGIDTILFRYNFRRYGDLELNRAIDACHKAGIAMLAMKTMGSVSRHLEAVVDFQSQEFTLGQAKLKSVWADQRISSIVSEMDSVRYVKENVNAARSEKPLTAEESHQLNQLAALTSQYACNGCKHLCENAVAQNVSIAAPLRFLMYAECHGKTARAKELYREIPADELDVSEEALQMASKACPQGIDIAARLNDARQMLA